MSAIPAEIEPLLKDGYRARREDRPADATSAFAKAVELSRASDDGLALVQSLKGLGQIERDLGDKEAALQHYQEAATICRTLDDLLLLAHTVRHVADIQRGSNHLSEADLNYAEVLAIYRSHPETKTLDLANTLRGYALLQSALEQKTEAITLWQEAGDLYNQVWQEPGSPYTEADLASGIAESQKQIAQLSIS